MTSNIVTWPLYYSIDVNLNEIFKYEKNDTKINKKLKFYTSSKNLEDIIKRYDIINTIENNTSYNIEWTLYENEANVIIIIDKTKNFLSESYSIEINNNKIIIYSNDLNGLQYSLLSLKQIIKQFIYNNNNNNNGIHLPKIFINDYPCIEKRSILISLKYFIYARREYHEKDINFLNNLRINNIIVLCDIFDDENINEGIEYNNQYLKLKNDELINDYSIELNEFSMICSYYNINLIPLNLIESNRNYDKNFNFIKNYFNSNQIIIAINNYYPLNFNQNFDIKENQNSNFTIPNEIFWNNLYHELSLSQFNSVVITQNMNNSGTSTSNSGISANNYSIPTSNNFTSFGSNSGSFGSNSGSYGFNSTPNSTSNVSHSYIIPFKEINNLKGICHVYETDYNFIFPSSLNYKPIIMIGDMVESLINYTRDYLSMKQNLNELNDDLSDSDLSCSSICSSPINSKSTKDSRFLSFFTFPMFQEFDYVCPDILMKYSISLFAGLAYRGESIFPIYQSPLPTPLIDLIMSQILPEDSLSISSVYTLTPEVKAGLIHLFQWNSHKYSSNNSNNINNGSNIPVERSLWQLSLMNPAIFSESQEGSGLFIPDVSNICIPSLDKILSCYSMYHTFLATIKFSPSSFKMARHRKLLKIGTKYYLSHSSNIEENDNFFDDKKYSKILAQESGLLSEIDELVFTINTLCIISRTIYLSAYLISSNISKPLTASIPFHSVQNNQVITGNQSQPPRRVAVYDNFDMSKPYSHKIHPKNDKIFNMLKNVVHQNILFRNFKSEEHSKIVEAFEYVYYENKGEVVIQQGDLGEFFYIVESGILDVFIESGGLKLKIGRTLSNGDYFGELALMYNTPRAASVITACNNTSLWRISRHTYRMIVTHHNKITSDEFYELVCNVHILGKRLGNVLSHAEINKVVSTLEVEEFEHDSVIIRQHQTGDYFYIILEGQVNVFQEVNSPNNSNFQLNYRQDKEEMSKRNSFLGKKVATLKRGDYFGEKALLADDVRQASCVAVGRVVCLSLSREDFIAMIGSLQDILEDTNVIQDDGPVEAPTKKTNTEIYDSQYHLSINFDDIERLNPLGTGSFGYVQIARHKSGQLYALKSQSKELITAQNMQTMVLNEVKIMTQLNHPFILKLHAAVQDNTYIYHLLELLPGGDFFSFLQKNGTLDENVCRFYSACVVLALEELHKLKIAYRDLKPENLVMDARGYIKLVDFGLAKQFLYPGGITWTMCGTPDYLAPEVILNKGHNYAVDYWALGIFLYEIRNGFPPFHDKQPMKIYEKVILGKVSFPTTFSKPLEDLILKFLVLNPSKRLGNMKLGFSAIMNHKWYGSFDWQNLLQGFLTAPHIPDLQQFDAELNSFKGTEGINFNSSKNLTEEFSSDWFPDCIPHC